MKILVINEGYRGVDAIISIIKMMSIDFSLCNTGEEGVEMAALGGHKLVIIARHRDDVIGNKLASRINRRNNKLKMIFIPLDSAFRKECVHSRYNNVILLNVPYEISDLSGLIRMSLDEAKSDTHLKYASRKQ